MKKGYDRRGLFGDIIHYDEHGKKIGVSKRGFFGSYTDYDASGKKIGRTQEGFFGRYKYYDNRGNQTGYSDPAMFVGTNHYDKSGNRVGHSDPTLISGWDHRRERLRRAAQGAFLYDLVNGRKREPVEAEYEEIRYEEIPTPPKAPDISYGSSATNYNRRR
ncbi:MAG: hypothetical protein IKQ97_05385 [Eubacterium sp.]|nr:hypothetical protein [Eubacterium sp.]